MLSRVRRIALRCFFFFRALRLGTSSISNVGYCHCPITTAPLFYPGCVPNVVPSLPSCRKRSSRLSGCFATAFGLNILNGPIVHSAGLLLLTLYFFCQWKQAKKHTHNKTLCFNEALNKNFTAVCFGNQMGSKMVNPQHMAAGQDQD